MDGKHECRAPRLALKTGANLGHETGRESFANAGDRGRRPQVKQSEPNKHGRLDDVTAAADAIAKNQGSPKGTDFPAKSHDANQYGHIPAT